MYAVQTAGNGGSELSIFDPRAARSDDSSLVMRQVSGFKGGTGADFAAKLSQRTRCPH